MYVGGVRLPVCRVSPQFYHRDTGETCFIRILSHCFCVFLLLCFSLCRNLAFVNLIILEES